MPRLSCSPTVWQCPKCKVWPVPAGPTGGGALPIPPPARPALLCPGAAAGAHGAPLGLPLTAPIPPAGRAATLPALLSSCWAAASTVALGCLGTVRAGGSSAAGAGCCRGRRGAAAAAVGILALAPLGHVTGCFHVSFDLLTGHLAALLTAALLHGELLGLAPVAGAASLPQGGLAFAAHCRSEGRAVRNPNNPESSSVQVLKHRAAQRPMTISPGMAIIGICSCCCTFGLFCSHFWSEVLEGLPHKSTRLSRAAHCSHRHSNMKDTLITESSME